MNTLIFDTETTGLPKNYKDPTDSRNPNLLQIGAILENEDREAVAQVDLLIYPEDNWILDEGAYNAHGISLDKAREFGVSHTIACEVFADLLSVTNRLVAHNLQYDLMVIMKAFHMNNIGWPDDLDLFCTCVETKDVVQAKDKLGRLKKPNLAEALKFFCNEEVGNAHQAIVDTIACRKVLHGFEDYKNEN